MYWQSMDLGLASLTGSTTFFSSREACILMKGYFTEIIFLRQGVPQGDIISPYIFILAVEILLIKINFTKHIKGIVFSRHEARSETFADDTSVFMERKEEYLRYSMKCINAFSKISGLKCNIEKLNFFQLGISTGRIKSARILN